MCHFTFSFVLFPLPSKAALGSHFPPQKCAIGFSATQLEWSLHLASNRPWMAWCLCVGNLENTYIKTSSRVEALFWQWLCLLSILINGNCCRETSYLMPLESFSGKLESFPRGLDILLSFSLPRVESTHFNQTFVKASSCVVARINCWDFSLWDPCLVTFAHFSVVPSRIKIIGKNSMISQHVHFIC